jgi:hypothetical protein
VHPYFPYITASLETVLVLDWYLMPSRLLELPTNVVGDLLVFGLLDGAFIALITLPQDVLLYPVNPYRLR